MNNQLLESVKFALEMEKKGYDLYTKTARETDQPVIAATFLGLAQRELEHKKRIEILYREVSKDTVDYTIIKGASLSIDRQAILDLIMTNLKEGLQSKSPANISMVFAVALQLEKDSYNYYKKLAAEITDSLIANFFALLAAEENLHYSIIQESQLYLNRPRDWFWGEERWLEEGE